MPRSIGKARIAVPGFLIYLSSAPPFVDEWCDHQTDEKSKNNHVRLFPGKAAKKPDHDIRPVTAE
jgi:hypothetical protein